MKKNPSRLGRGLRSLVSDYRKPQTEPERPNRRDGTEDSVPASDQPDRDETVPSMSKTPELQDDLGTKKPSATAESLSAVADEIENIGTERKQHQSGAAIVSTDDLRPNPHQPRSEFDSESVAKLAESISVNGILQPIVVRTTLDGLEILAGERRWRAAKLAGLKSVPVVIREATDEQMLELALVENIQREDLNAIDRARAYQRFCDAFGLSAEDVAKRVGEDRTTVVNYLRLLDLPDEVRRMVARGAITMGHARSIAGVRDERRQVELGWMVTRDSLSVRDLERKARQEKREATTKGAMAREPVPAQPVHIRDLERRFEEALGTKVRISVKEGNTGGRIMIEFYGVDDFERIAEIVGALKST